MNCHLILRSLALSTVKNCRKNIYTTTVYKLPDVWEPDDKGRTQNKIYTRKKSVEEQLWEEKSYFEKIKLEYELFKKECNVFKNEIKSAFDGPFITYNAGEVDVVWRFSENPECLEEWIVTADSDCDEGFSSAKYASFKRVFT